MESLFEFLFKYRPLIFERGDFMFNAPWPIYVAAVAGVTLLVPTVLLYSRARGKSSPTDRVVLSGVRILVLALVLFSLFRPVLVLSTVVPQKNFLGILVDDSRSMRLADVDGTSRSSLIRQYFDAENSELLSALAEKFILRFFRFSTEAERIDDVTAMGFTGNKTDLGRALNRARQELASVPLAGLVMMTDGADNTHESLEEPLLALRARSVPVYTVGLGQEEFPRDIEVSRVETPRSVLLGASLVVDVTVTQTGYTGSSVDLIVEDNGRIVNTQRVELPREGEVATVRIPFKATEPGPRVFGFRIAPLDGELVEENNEQEALIVVEDQREKILYFEGEPRWEIGFLRRAVADDENLEVTLLTRTADNKFYRILFDNPDEKLVGGFPTTREELFEYQGLVIGSAEASFFTLDQLRMIADFVSQRGGGLLMLGGRRAFVEGGYADTPIADVLPVVLEETDGEEDFLAEVQVRVTPSGRTHPITQLAETIDESAVRWEDLPPLMTVNRITETKPGATTLLEGEGSGISGQVVLAYQRYGRGKSLVLPVRDLWSWQMRTPLEDMTHETFWRQLLRWVVSGVPNRVRVSPVVDRVAPEEAIELLGEVEDDTYLKVNNTSVVARVTSPSGMVDSVAMDWTVDRDGEYRAALMPREDGLHKVEVSALEDGEFLASDASYVRVKDPAREYFGSEMQGTTLRRIADETGGLFYTPSTVETLPEDISFTESGTTVVEQRDLWDMPIIFMLLMILISTEWGYRRLRGLV
jgi:uncharacterized membrane protein